MRTILVVEPSSSPRLIDYDDRGGRLSIEDLRRLVPGLREAGTNRVYNDFCEGEDEECNL